MKYKTLILDFNGTLLDDCDCCLKILNILTKKYGLKHVSKEEYKDIFTFPVINYYKKLGFDFKGNTFEIIGEQFHKLFDELSLSEAWIFPSALDLLKKLQGKINIVCLSASKHETLIAELKYYNIENYFDEVLGISDKLARSKMHIGINWIKNKNINPNEVLFVGDSIHDLEVANAMNVDCILISTGHTSKERLLKTNCKVIDDLSELLAIIL